MSARQPSTHKFCSRSRFRSKSSWRIFSAPRHTKQICFSSLSLFHSTTSCDVPVGKIARCSRGVFVMSKCWTGPAIRNSREGGNPAQPSSEFNRPSARAWRDAVRKGTDRQKHRCGSLSPYLPLSPCLSLGRTMSEALLDNS